MPTLQTNVEPGLLAAAAYPTLVTKHCWVATNDAKKTKNEQTSMKTTTRRK